MNYERNTEEPDCLENEILDSDLQMVFPPITLFEHFVRDAQLTEYVTQVIYKTVDSLPTFTLDTSTLPPYPPFPQGFNLPVVPIPSLRRDPDRDRHPFVEPVFLGDNSYAFKHYGDGPVERQMSLQSDTADNALIQEVTFLSRLDTPFIIKPLFLISAEGRFRGFLMPFAPAGSLAQVFHDLRREAGTDDDVWRPPSLSSQTAGSLVGVDNASGQFPLANRTKRIPWESWALDFVRGVVVLHHGQMPSFCGDLKLDNTLVLPDGHLCLIDVAPQRGWTEPYLPPEMAMDIRLRRGRPELTAPRDVFAMGLVLWALSEEIEEFERDDVNKPPQMMWTNVRDSNSPPMWYKALVEECVRPNAAERPSAETVLARLAAHVDMLD